MRGRGCNPRHPSAGLLIWPALLRRIFRVHDPAQMLHAQSSSVTPAAIAGDTHAERQVQRLKPIEMRMGQIPPHNASIANWRSLGANQVVRIFKSRNDFRGCGIAQLYALSVRTIRPHMRVPNDPQFIVIRLW